MVKIIYSLAINLYSILIHIVAPFNNKAKQWVNGRNNWEENLRNKLSKVAKERIWMHCSSLGEFEQGRPLLEALRVEFPGKALILSFFSPSGYNIRKNYQVTDLVCYLPIDTSRNARRFVELVEPELTIFVKYDLWLNYFIALKQRDLKLILISALIKKPLNGIFRRLYLRKCYLLMDWIFVQDLTTKEHLAAAGARNIVISGDTRIDRVTALPIEASLKDLSVIEKFKDNKMILVCGSTWHKDEKILLSLFESNAFNDWKAIIAPHEIDTNDLALLQSSIPFPSVLLSKLDENSIDRRFLIVDSVGQLSTLYSFGNLAYIGGGFGKGIHNTLEPAAFVLPVIIGPKYKKFQEANQLVAVKAFTSIMNKKQLLKAFEYYQNPSFYKDAVQQIIDYIYKNKGATDKIMNNIKSGLLKYHD